MTEGGERVKRAKGVKYIVTEGDQALGGEYTMQYTDDVLQICTPDTLNGINQCYPPPNLILKSE